MCQIRSWGGRRLATRRGRRGIRPAPHVHTPLLSFLSHCHLSILPSQWYFRSKLDMYSALVGCLLAEARPYILRLYARFDGTVGTAARIGVLGGALGLHWSTVMANPDRKSYNGYHPYTSWVPICLFICLRNATPWLRGAHASTLALMGRHSLELYLLQFHVSGLSSVTMPHERAMMTGVEYECER